MQITVKTLKGEMIDIEVQPATTIYQLKEKIKQQKGFDIEAQKVVFKGKATQNDDTIDKLNIKEKDFLVVMATVKKPESKKEQKSAEQKGPVANGEEKSEVKPQKKSQQISGDQDYQAKITNLINMGFPRQKCIQSLQAAFGDSDRAVEFLLTGIPSGLSQGQVQGQGQQQNPLQALMGSQQMNQLRQMLISDPSSMGPLLEQLQQTSPQLYQVLAHLICS